MKLNRNSLFFLTCLFLPFCAFSNEEKCSFHLPSKWKLADPKKLPPKVVIGLTCPKKNGLCPSLNLVTESTRLSEEKYLEAVMRIHSADSKQQVRFLGKIATRSGSANLLQINRQDSFCDLRQLQMICVKSGTAHILTATVRKEDFLSSFDELRAIFSSVAIGKELALAPTVKQNIETARLKIENALKIEGKGLSKSQLKELFFSYAFQFKHVIPFERAVQQQCEKEGAYFQLLLIQEEQKKLSLLFS